MNEVKKMFLELKEEPIYLDLMTGKLNMKMLKDTPVHFANSEFFIQIQQFMIKLNKIINHVKKVID